MKFWQWSHLAAGQVEGEKQSAVSLEGQGVVALPGGTAGGADLVGPVALDAQATVVLARAGQPAQLPVLVHWVHDPVEPGVLHHDANNNQHDANDHQRDANVISFWTLVHWVHNPIWLGVLHHDANDH